MATPISPKDCATWLPRRRDGPQGERSHHPAHRYPPRRHSRRTQRYGHRPGLQNDRMLDLTAALAWAEKQCHAPYKVLLGTPWDPTPSCLRPVLTISLECAERTALMRTSPCLHRAPAPSSPAIPGKHPQTLFVLTGTRDKGLEGIGNGVPSPMTACPRMQVAGRDRRRDAHEFCRHRLRGENRETHALEHLRVSRGRPHRPMHTPARAVRDHAQEQVSQVSSVIPSHVSSRPSQGSLALELRARHKTQWQPR